MSRAPYVVSATVVGVAALLAYHPTANSGSVPGTSVTIDPGASSSNAPHSSGDSSSSPSPTPASQDQSSSAAPVTSNVVKTTTTTGDLVTIGGGREYGHIQVKVTRANGKLTSVGIVTVDADGGRSQSIDDEAVPILLQQTAAAGSAQIDGVSGATYTSRAYAESLQSAIDGNNA